MAELLIKTGNIAGNIRKISLLMQKHGYHWSLVTKVLSGDHDFLEKLLSDELMEGIHSIGDSRLSSLKMIKKVNPALRTIYIKPPARNLVKQVVEYADVSLNSSLDTIRALNQEAGMKHKIHEIIIMIELGELREGVLRNKLLDFYRDVFELDHIRVIGIGTNLGCMYGIEPTYDKLMQLTLYKQLLEVSFKKNIPFVSGGSSITLPLIKRNKIPTEMNHFRIGEAAFFGTSPLDNKRFNQLSTDTFQFNANILEMEEKETVPDGKIGEGNIGHTADLEPSEELQKTFRVLLDFGILDVDTADLEPKDRQVQFMGTTSDLTVYDVGQNLNSRLRQKYKVGKTVSFKPNYMAVARLMNSKFIDVKIV
ncbi:MAG TPA: alanine/ornithine racemase family PLP-dependent enzyme [Bacteroidetes bacterium]|nr:alanine/ornithine racemase family PLP-dependent enzyme [Bacteroidota bacterium]